MQFLAQQPEAHSLFTPSLMLDHWSEVLAMLGTQQFDSLVQALVREGHTPFYSTPRYDQDKAALYASLVRANPGKAVEFSAWAANALKETDKDTWLTQLTD